MGGVGDGLGLDKDLEMLPEVIDGDLNLD